MREVTQATETTGTLTAAPTLPLAVPDVDLTKSVSPLETPAILSPDNSADVMQTDEAADKKPLDDYWLPPEIAKPPEGKCPADLQVCLHILIGLV